MNDRMRSINGVIKRWLGAKDEVNPILKPHYQVLEQRLNGAIHFLRHHRFQHLGEKISLSKLPWFLILGASESGKTSLLLNSQIKYILDKKIKRDSVPFPPPTEACDWWATSNAIFIDVPGKYICLKEKKVSLSNKLWERFLFKVEELRGGAGINGGVLTLSTEELFNQDLFKQRIDMFKFRMRELQAKFGMDLPFYLIITKADLLPGFVDFFSEFSKEELQQVWGIPLYPTTTLNESIELFNKRFNILIKRLNEQVINRLHQEKSLHTKYYIKDFPLQLERLKIAIEELLKLFAHNPRPASRQDMSRSNSSSQIRGVYMTSALQTEDVNYLSQQREIVLANQFQQALALMQTPPAPSKPYFIKQLFLHFIQPRKSVLYQDFFKRKEFLAYVATILISSGIILFSSRYLVLPNKMHKLILAEKHNHTNVKYEQLPVSTSTSRG